MDGTPIFDIKPYLPYTDIHPDATGGFTDQVERGLLEVAIPDGLLAKVPEEKRKALAGVLAQDPRPSYLSAVRHGVRRHAGALPCRGKSP